MQETTETKVVGNSRYPIKIREYSWEELQEECLRHDEHNYGITIRPEWVGEHATKLVERMKRGDGELARQAEGKFQDLMDVILPATVGGVGERIGSPVGSQPNVPAYLAGHPNSMYRREPSETKGPFRLFVEISTSASVKQEAALAKGLACTALAYAIQCTRPVELWIIAAVTDGPKHLYVKTKIGTAPLDMSRVSVALSTIGLGRRMYTMHGERYGNSQYHVRYGGCPAFPDRDLLHLGKDDVFVPFISSSDAKNVLADPLKWLLDRCKNQLEEAGVIWTTAVDTANL